MKELYTKLMTELKILRQLESEYNAQKRQVNLLKQEIMTTMRDIGTDVYSAELGRVNIIKTVIPQVTDWSLVYSHVARQDAFDLLQRRITAAAWRDRVEEQGNIPGIEPFENTTLRVTQGRSS